MLLWTLKWIYFFKLQFFLDICAGVGLLDHKVILFSVFWGTYTLFCIVAAPTYISTNSVGKFPFLHTLSSMCRLLNDGHSDWCEVVPHCSFGLHFSNIYWCWASFHVPASQLYVFLKKCLLKSFAHFYIGLFGFLLLSCISCLYILKVKSLSVPSFENIFFLFFFFYGFLSCAKVCKFDWVPFVYFCFYFYCLQRQTLVQFMSENSSPMLSSGSFMVSCLMFKTLSHFEFIFVHGVRMCSNFIDSHANVQLFQLHLLKRLSFSHFIFLLPLSKISWS